MSRSALRLASMTPLLWVVLTGSAVGQSAAIRGRILDEQAQPIPAATVTVTTGATGFLRTDISDADGLYRFPGLPAPSPGEVVGTVAVGVQGSRGHYGHHLGAEGPGPRCLRFRGTAQADPSLSCA